jgi:hypothetical protein
MNPRYWQLRLETTAATLLQAMGRRFPALDFYRFQCQVHPRTWGRHESILRWALSQPTPQPRQFLEADRPDDSPLIRQTRQLLRETWRQFHDKWKSQPGPRVAVHLPPAHLSPGGFSLFSNLISGLEFIGISTAPIPWDAAPGLERWLDEFQPTVLLTSDHPDYLDRLDWPAIERHRRRTGMQLGLTAADDDPALEQSRIDWARRHELSFYYSFRCPEYVQRHYQAAQAAGFAVHDVEFGANPLIYLPLAGVERDLPYVFLASANRDKWDRYFRYLPPLVSKYPGLIDGPGWRCVKHWSARPQHAALYARARVAINLHIDVSIDSESELNERTYILAACGAPQLIDLPRLLFKRFSEGCFFVADQPRDYLPQFERMLADPAESQRRALQAQREVYARHTVFHRADHLVRQIMAASR